MLSTLCFAHLAVINFEIVLDWKLSPTRLLRLISLAHQNFHFHWPKGKIYLPQGIGPGLFPAWLCILRSHKHNQFKKFTWSTVDWPLIRTCSIFNWHLSRQLVNSRLIFADMPLNVDWYIWIAQHSTDYRPTANWVSIRCGSRTDVDRVSTVSTKQVTHDP